MKEKGSLLSSLRLIGYLTQFGLSVVMPPLILVFLGVWLTDRYGIGIWLILVLLACGLVSSGCSIYRFFKVFLRETKDKPYGKPEQEKGEDEEDV